MRSLEFHENTVVAGGAGDIETTTGNPAAGGGVAFLYHAIEIEHVSAAARDLECWLVESGTERLRLNFINARASATPWIILNFQGGFPISTSWLIKAKLKGAGIGDQLWIRTVRSTVPLREVVR